MSSGALEGRIDVSYYKNDFISLFNNLNTAKYTVVKFRTLFKSITNGFDFREYKEEGTPYIKVANVRQGEFNFEKIQYIDFSSETLSKKIQLKKSNLLLTRKGTFGNALSLEADYDYVISSEVFYIELDNQSINSKYLEIFFNSAIGQSQFKKVAIGAIMGSLSQEVIKSLKIPLPDLYTQAQIVATFNLAYQVKQAKEQQAKELLAGIDGYLLDKLGIKSPLTFEGGTKTFFVNASQVLGGRLDPFYHSKFFQDATNSVKASKYEFVPLKKVIQKLKSGSTPHQSLEPYDDENGIIFLRNTDLKPYELELDEVKYVKPEFKHLLTFSEKNELIICIAGTVGTSAVNNFEKKISINQNITTLKLQEDLINPYFLSAYLNTKLGIEFTKRVCSLATIYYLNNENLKGLQIPLPPLAIQNEIAEHISAVRRQAKDLEAQASAGIAQAKAEVERLILGEI